jgi:hypothetical protein
MREVDEAWGLLNAQYDNLKCMDALVRNCKFDSQLVRAGESMCAERVLCLRSRPASARM